MKKILAIILLGIIITGCKNNVTISYVTDDFSVKTAINNPKTITVMSDSTSGFKMYADGHLITSGGQHNPKHLKIDQSIVYDTIVPIDKVNDSVWLNKHQDN